MHVRIDYCLVLLLSCLSVCAAEVPQELQGRWQLREVHQQDRVSRIDHPEAGCAIDAKTLTLKAEAVTQNYQLSVDPQASPPQLDTVLKVGEQEQLSRAIYHIKGNELTICFALPNEPRPVGFSAHIGEPHYMWVFRRPQQKPAETPEPKQFTPEQLAQIRAASHKLQGEWELSTMEWDGRKFSGNIEGKIVIQGDRATSFGGSEPIGYQLRINPTTTPAQIDLVLTQDGKESIKRGVYAIDGDRLVLCHPLQPDQPRPTELKTRAGDGLLLSTLVRKPIQQTSGEDR